MPLDPNIPLSVKQPQLPSAADVLQQRASIANMGAQQRLQEQQIAQNDAALKENTRQQAGRNILAQLIPKYTKVDPKTHRQSVDYQGLATEYAAAGFPDQAEAFVKTGLANAKAFDEIADLGDKHKQAIASKFGDLMFDSKSEAEFTANLAAAAVHGLIDESDAAQLEKEEAAQGWEATKNSYQRFSPRWQEQQKELTKPEKLGPGDVLNTPERAAAGLGPLMTGGDKPKNEWESFQSAYAQKAGAKDWNTLTPDQQMAGFSEFKLSGQDPAMRELMRQNAEVRNLMLKAQADQQPTPEDAKVIAQQIIDHKMAPSQLALFGGFGSAGSAFKRMVGVEALKLDKDFDWEQSEGDYQFSKSAGFQSTTRFMQSVLDSMPRLLDNAKKLGNTTMRDVNALINKGKTEFNNVDLKKFNTDRLLVGDEVAKILQGGGTGSSTSDAKLKQASQILSENDSVPAMASALEEIHALIGYRQKALTRGTYLERQTPTPSPADLPKGLPSGASVVRH